MHDGDFPKKLTVVTTDFGADCDDQKAVSNLIADLAEGEELAFIVNGPQPRLAAAAIAQAHHNKTGRYPLITTGEKFGDELPSDRMYSLVNGLPIEALSAFIDTVKVPSEEFQKTIDLKIKNGKIGRFEQVTLAPLRSNSEYYNSARLSDDAGFQEKWGGIEKTAITQFQRDKGAYKGNNYQKSSPGVADAYLTMLEDQHFTQVYFDGAVAKNPNFLLPMTQPTLPGVEKAVAAYIELKQVPWLSMSGKSGATPGRSDMRAAMFTSDAQVPFGVHVSGVNPAGFGVERILKEVCGISACDEGKYKKSMAAINAELEAFDRQVFEMVRKTHPEIYDVGKMRDVLHGAMIDTLRNFGQSKGVGEPPLQHFTELFERMKKSNSALNAYTYMDDFKKLLFKEYPMAETITRIAEEEKNRPRADGFSHMWTMASILGEQGARAVAYDAVAVAALRVVTGNPNLCEHFREDKNGIVNISAAGMENLKENHSDRFALFESGVRSALMADGGRLAPVDSRGLRFALSYPQSAEQDAREIAFQCFEKKYFCSTADEKIGGALVFLNHEKLDKSQIDDISALKSKMTENPKIPIIPIILPHTNIKAMLLNLRNADCDWINDHSWVDLTMPEKSHIGEKKYNIERDCRRIQSSFGKEIAFHDRAIQTGDENPVKAHDPYVFGKKKTKDYFRKNTFICYPGTDRSLVGGFVGSLRDKGVNVFYDYDDCTPGEPHQEIIKKVLGESTNAVICLNGKPLGTYQTIELDVLSEKEIKLCILRLSGADNGSLKEAIRDADQEWLITHLPSCIDMDQAMSSLGHLDEITCQIADVDKSAPRAKATQTHVRQSLGR